MGIFDELLKSAQTKWSVDWLHSLLQKATAPAVQPNNGPRPTVPPAQPVKVSDSDVVNHQNKRHYNYSHEAEKVVHRSIEQSPHTSQTLHHYKCPVCHNEGIKESGVPKRKWLVGHAAMNQS